MEQLFFHRIRLGEMTQTGYGILRTLPDNIQKLDLLVRESIQNSLDAADSSAIPSVLAPYGSPYGYVDVDFRTGTFASEEFSCLLDGIKERLQERFNGEQTFLAIRDKHTLGLSGAETISKMPTDENGNPIFSNYWKLIRDIRKNQEREGAGGSHGVGKTIYSKVGIGLVVYYSRFRNEENGFSSRLVICLLEDERSQNRILPAGNREYAGGIANWGMKNDDNPDDFLPLTNEVQIKNILDLFKLPMYENNETGTTIIIPYTDNTQLLENILQSRGNEDNGNVENEVSCAPWLKNVEAYLRVAVQRWYAPRLNNKSFPSLPYLNVAINGDYIQDVDLKPFFKTIRILYNSAAKMMIGQEDGSDDKTPVKSDDNTSVKNKKIVLGNSGRNNSIVPEKVAGVLSYIEIEKNELGENYGDVIDSPYLLINNYEIGDNSPIVMYVRKPGMIVSYQDKEWLPELTCPENKFIIALFLANEEYELKNQTTKNQTTLENYLRATEGPDHAVWKDFSGNTIIKRIRNKVKSCLREVFAKPLINPDLHINTNLGEELAQWLLFPSEDFGHGSNGSQPSRPKTQHSPRRKSKDSLVLVAPIVIENGMMELTYTCICSSPKAEIELIIGSDGRNKIGLDEWKKQTETPFPLAIVEMKNDSLFTLKGKKFEYCPREEARFISSRINSTTFSIAFDTEKPEYRTFKIDLHLKITNSDSKYQASVIMKNKNDSAEMINDDSTYSEESK